MRSVKFTPKEILQKDFRQKLRGYDPTEVDSFLDIVIRDYQTFGKIIKNLQGENNELRYRLDNIKSATPNPQLNQKTSVHMTNAVYDDILKRLNNLEQKMPQ